MKYRKKPIEVEALQIHRNVEEIKEFIGENGDAYTAGDILDRPHTVVIIYTLEGIMRATDGDYIIKGVKGEFYPCRKDIFEETYELLTENDQIYCDRNLCLLMSSCDECPANRKDAEEDCISESYRAESEDVTNKHDIEIYDVDAYATIIDNKESMLRIEWNANIGFGQYDIVFTNDIDDNGDSVTTTIKGYSEYLDSNEKKEFIRLLLDKLVDKMEVKE